MAVSFSSRRRFLKTSLAGAAIVAERFRAAVAGEPFVVQGGDKLPVTVSIGVAVTGPQQETLDSLLKRADEALYAAKNAGRNRVATLPVTPAPFEPEPLAVAS